MTRLERQKPTRRPWQRVQPFKMARGYWVNPHSQWGASAAPIATEQPASTAAAGTPGSFGPASSTVPTRANLIANNPVSVVPSPASAWTSGQYIQCVEAGAAGEASWNGTAWATGRRP